MKKILILIIAFCLTFFAAVACEDVELKDSTKSEQGETSQTSEGLLESEQESIDKEISGSEEDSEAPTISAEDSSEVASEENINSEEKSEEVSEEESEMEDTSEKWTGVHKP